MGAWIEIHTCVCKIIYQGSPLTWGRGLKYHEIESVVIDDLVAPHVGAWIEILEYTKSCVVVAGRPSRGGVD